MLDNIALVPLLGVISRTSAPRDFHMAVAWAETYDETVNSQSMEGNHEASSFVTCPVDLSRRCASRRPGGRDGTKFDTERHLQ